MIPIIKRKREIVALLIALGALGAVFVGRRLAYEDAVDPKYQAALYYAHIRAVDDQTSEPLSIKIKWDYELITPYIKGSGPSIIETHADKSVTVALVGRRLESGLRIGIAADGYHREGVDLVPDEGGVLKTDSSRMITEVRLRRTSQKDATPMIE
jgi:hypothetical protein